MKGKNNQGFTLIEVITVLGILAILAAVLMPSFQGLVTGADKKRALMECRNGVQAAQTLFVDHYENQNLVTAARVKERAELQGEVTLLDAEHGTLNHLVVLTGRWQVTFCKASESCSQHSELYTLSGEVSSSLPVDYFYIGNTTDYRVKSLGNLEEYDFGLYGFLVPSGSVFYWEGDFYYTRNSQYLTNSSNRENYIANYGVKVNSTSFVTPGNATQPGDLKQTGAGVSIFFPYSRYSGDYEAENYWFPVTIE